MRPRSAVELADDNAMVLPWSLIERPTSQADSLRLLQAKRAWYRSHGINPSDFHEISKVWQASGRAHGIPLSAVDRDWVRKVGLVDWQRAHGYRGE